MLTILRHLKKSALAILFVVILLFIQAYSDLSLPAYTSDIVNVGILQGGIDSLVPEVIRASQLERILLFMDEDGKNDLLNHYTLLDKNTLSQKDWDNYLDKYPLMSEEALYIWDGEDEKNIKKLISEPILINTLLEYEPQVSEQSDEMIPNLLPPELLASGMDLISILDNLPDEALATII